MLHSNASLFDNLNNTWDTNFARQFLHIPEDQLNMLKSIPEWSVSRNEIDSTRTTNSEVISIPEQQTSKALSSSDKNISNLRTSVKNTELCKEQIHNTLKLKAKTVTFPAVEKSLFLKSVSLVSIIKPDKYFSVHKLKRSSSLTDIHKEASFNMPDVAEEANMLDKTYVVPAVLDDRTNNLESTSKRRKSFDENFLTPVKIPAIGPIEKLDDNILKHKYLNESSLSAAVSLKNDPLIVVNPLIPSEINQHSLLSKKLMLLEKRFSPCKEVVSNPSTPNSKSKQTSDSVKGFESVETPSSHSTSQKKTTSPASIHFVDKGTVSSPLVAVFDKISPSLGTKSPAKMYPQQREVATSEAQFLKGGCDDGQEDSFISQPIPCAQPPSVETRPISQSEQFRKPDKEKILSKSQSMESSVKSNLPKTTGGTFSVFSAQCNKADDHGTDVCKDRSTKRKRKTTSKSTKMPKKFQIAKEPNLHFTADQIISMIEIMKMFQ